MKHIYRTILPCVVALFCCLLPAFSITGEHPVLIISSYNPDAGRTSSNISDFMEEFQRLGGTNTVALENMNCKSFSEAPFWEKRMAGLLSKYQNDKSPALIVLIGQEAWAAYLSLEDSVRGNTPVVSALSSRNAILLPGDTIDLKTWMPESVDFFTDFPDSPIKAGFVYEYDVEANINMVKQMYPDTENIAFISDNSYGGVAMQAYVVKEMKKFPELDLILLDGRVNTIYTICDRLHELPEHTAVLMGTWRVDMNDGYFMRNATYAMMEAAPALPTFFRGPGTQSTNQFLFECEREVVEMRTDVQRLQQVVINLLSNADKFTKEGTITLKLELDTARNVAVFSVTDTGCGIPLDKQKRVFERFEKLNEYVQGTGLGLSICKLTVEKWGGEIWIDPAYTNGARFMFTHPMNL